MNQRARTIAQNYRDERRKTEKDPIGRAKLDGLLGYAPKYPFRRIFMDEGTSLFYVFTDNSIYALHLDRVVKTFEAGRKKDK